MADHKSLPTDPDLDDCRQTLRRVLLRNDPRTLDQLARFSESRVTHQARQVLCRLLPQGEPKRETVAQTLHLSQRTLQRRLQEEGTSFQALLDVTRRELAEQYLAQPNMTLLEIAYLSGFADPSNFFRAFRRWFDETPGEYRARM